MGSSLIVGLKTRLATSRSTKQDVRRGRCCACLRQWLRHVQGRLRRRRRPQGRLPLHCRTSPPPGCHGRYGTEGCLRRGRGPVQEGYPHPEVPRRARNHHQLGRHGEDLAPPCTPVSLTACRRRSPPLPPPPSRSRSSLPPRGSTPSGSEAPSWLPSPPSSRCGSPSRSTTSAAPPSSTASASKHTLTLQASAKRGGKQYTGLNRHHLHLLVSGVIPCFLFNHFSIIWPFGCL